MNLANDKDLNDLHAFSAFLKIPTVENPGLKSSPIPPLPGFMRVGVELPLLILIFLSRIFKTKSLYMCYKELILLGLKN